MADQRDFVQQLVEQGIVRPNLIVAELMEHCANNGLIRKVLVLAPKFDQTLILILLLLPPPPPMLSPCVAELS